MRDLPRTHTPPRQTEGATALDGRSPSVWDKFVNSDRSRVRDGSTADTACDFYHRYKDDIALMKSLGVKNFRFSISWSRLIPGGRKGDPVNPKARGAPGGPGGKGLGGAGRGCARCAQRPPAWPLVGRAVTAGFFRVHKHEHKSAPPGR